jgi:apolipoprotein N-acyltransferase
LLVQGDVAAQLRWQRAHATRVLRAYADLTRDALRERSEKPALVVWPENAIQTAPDDPSLGPPLLGFVRAIGVPLVVGAPRAESRASGGARYNAAHLLRPDGSRAHYDKIRLLPLSETALLAGAARHGDLEAETWSAGRTPGLFEVGGERLGVLICLEATYPGMARTLERAGATALLNLSNDGWYRGRGGDRQHLQQVVFRAIETGLPVVRVTTTGITAVIAPDGSIAATLPPGPGALRIRVPAPSPVRPLYARVGDVFAWSCVAFCALAAGVGARRAPRARWR